jgi:hypothetical protein
LGAYLLLSSAGPKTEDCFPTRDDSLSSCSKHQTVLIETILVALVSTYSALVRMPNPLRAPKFNASARKSSVGGSRKKGKAKRAAAGSLPTPEVADPNAEIVVPKSKQEREQERKERLRQEVRIRLRPMHSADAPQLESAPESKMTSKKRKRLDKYIVRALALPLGRPA